MPPAPAFFELPALPSSPFEPAPRDELGERADKLVAEALTIETSGDLAVGEQKLEEAIELYAQKGDRLGQIGSLSILARFRVRTASAPAALTCFDRAEALASQGGNPFEGFIALMSRGSFEREQGLSNHVAGHLIQALELLRQARQESTPVALGWLLRIGQAALQPGDSLSAVEGLFPPEMRGVPLQMPPAVIRTLQPLLFDLFESDLVAVLASVLLDAGEADEAAVRLAEAPLPEHPDILATGARLARAQGDHPRARRLAERALVAAADLPPDRAFEGSRNTTAQLEAIDAHARATGTPLDLTHWHRALERARKDGDRAVEVRILTALGNRLGRYGQPTEGRAHLERAIELAQELGRPGLESDAREDLAWLLNTLGEQEAAVREAERARELFRQRNDTSNVNQALTQIGSLYSQVGASVQGLGQLQAAKRHALETDDPFGARTAHAIEIFHQAALSHRAPPSDLLPIFAATGFDAFEIELFSQFFSLMDQMSNLDDGARLVEEATKFLELTQRAGSPLFESFARMAIASGLLLEKRCADAQLAFEDLLELHRQFPGLREVEALARGGLAAAMWAQGDTGGGLQLMSEAIEGIEQIQAGFHTGGLLESFVGSRRPDLYSSFVEMLVASGRVSEAFETTERERARAFLQQLVDARPDQASTGSSGLLTEAETLRAKLRDLDKNIAESTIENYSNRLGLAGERDKTRLEYEQLLLRIQLLQPEYVSLVKPDPISLTELQTQVLDTDTTLVAYYTGISKRTHVWIVERDDARHLSLEISADRLAAELTFLHDEIISRSPKSHFASSFYRELITPLLPHLRHRKLIIVPHDVLHQLPFAALQDPATGKRLIEQFALAFAPSASALRFLAARRSPYEGRALVLGDPDGTLPGARAETEAVAGRLGIHPLLGPEASESQVYRNSGRVDLLHIAAHARFDDPRPRFSFLKLAADDAEDGRLEMHEVVERLDLRGTDLVVLSACETALGQPTGGDEQIGLTRAFLLAGGSAVMTTSWRVDDTASAALMELFYTRLASGATVADALRGAQRQVMRQKGWEDPYFWAGFTLHGDADVRLQP